MPPESLPERDTCIELLRDKRWKKGLRCINCLSQEIVRNGLRDDGIQQYRCKECGRSFNDRSGTLLEETDLRIEECLYSAKRRDEGASTNKISDELGRSWETISNFLERLEIRLGFSKLISSVNKQIYQPKRNLERFEQNKEVDYSRIGCK